MRKYRIHWESTHLMWEREDKSTIIRPSQIKCMVTTMHIMCMQMMLHVHENSWMVLIHPCKNNLNLLLCSSLFSVQCLVASSSCSCCHTCYLTALCWFFCLFAFIETNFVAQPCTKRLVSVHLTLQTGKISLNRSAEFMYKFYQQNFRIIPTYVIVEK